MFFSPLGLEPAEEGSSAMRLRALSLGAGVQSTTLALMAAHGEIGPMPDCAIFADTGWEPQALGVHPGLRQDGHARWCGRPGLRRGR